MPIKGLTTDVQPAFPRIGKLRKGGPAPRDAQGNVTRMGPDLEYFRFTSERPEVQAAFENAYGEKIAIIDVYLPHATPEANFDCWKEKWAGGGLVHRCDSETMTIWLKPDGTYSREPKPCDGGCKEIGRLSLILPELVKAGHVGYVTLETHGKNDLMSIMGSLMAAAEARIDTELGLRGIRWSLRRIKEKVSTPMNGKRVRRDKWLVKLEPAADWATLQLDVARKANMLELPAPQTIDPETGEINPPELSDIEPPEDVEDGDFTDADLPPLESPAIPEPQGEEAAKADMREKIEKQAKVIGWKNMDAFWRKVKELYAVELETASVDQLLETYERLKAQKAS